MKRSSIIYYVDLQVLAADGWVTILTIDYDCYEAAHEAILDAMEIQTSNTRQRFVLRRQALTEHSWTLY